MAGIHALGQPIADLSTDEAVEGVYMDIISQTFDVLGMAIARSLPGSSFPVLS